MKISLFILTVLLSSHAFAAEETRAVVTDESRGVTETRQVQPSDNHHEDGIGMGEWQLENNQGTVSIKLDSYSNSATDSPVALTIRCSANVTELYIGWGDDFESSKVNVTSSVVGHHSKTVPWEVSSSGKSTFYPQRSTIRYIKHLVKYDKVSTEANTHDGDVLAAVFYTEGLKKAIRPIRTACNW